MALNAICKRDQYLWMIVVSLICYYIVECHLPICVVRQFGGLQTIVVQHKSTSHILHEQVLHYSLMYSMFRCKLVWL
jgi:hypothetical protein